MNDHIHSAGIIGRWPILVALALVCIAGAGAALSAAHGEQPATPPSATLNWKDRDALPGTLVDSAYSDRLIWKSPLFAEPLEVPLTALKAVHFPVTTKPVHPEGEYCFEMAGGDIVFGALVSLDGDTAVIDATGFGRLHVARTSLRRMYRWNQNELIYTGPTGLAGWQTTGSPNAWREEGSHLGSDEVGAVIRRDFAAPSKARFEFELSWQKKADFDLALGVGSDPKSVLRAFRFDVWDNKLVAWRETDRDADVAPLVKIESGPGHVQLLALLDQEEGRLLVFASDGKQLADLKVPTAKAQPFGGLQLTNRNGDIRIEHLRIGRWTGEIPRPVESDKARIHAPDGTIAYGQLKSYDAARRQFIVASAEGEKRLDEAQVQDIFLAQDENAPARAVSAAHISGIRVSGELMKIENNRVWIKSPGVQEPLSSRIDELYSLVIVAPPEAAPPAAGREGRLEVGGVSLHGSLAPSRDDGSPCLVWLPRHCAQGVPLAPGAKGRIVYRDQAAVATPKKRQQVQAQVVEQNGPVGRVVAMIQDPAGSAHGKPKANAPAVLHLRYGDAIPCTVSSIDENGITFASAVTEATFVKHDQVQALELMPDAAPATILPLKKERLLMLPRMQRVNPPTHLIRSIDGDYLRGRLTGMDGENVQVEVRLETKTLPRTRIARIVWLYSDEADERKPDADAVPATTAMRVQALEGNGNRLTFVADHFENEKLSGRSELLGVCHVDVGKINELLIGSAIEQAAATLAFHQWHLTAAPDPLASPDGESGDGGSNGRDAALVGKPAPDFQLNTLDGKKFQLASLKGNVVVLDFWASWCGPCMQTMPQVDKVAAEFSTQGVQLLAVNLEEAPAQVKAALERLQLDMPVGLDKDGRVAEKYGATAIPQTVIVDRDGNVARLYVGAAGNFDETLRTALKEVLSGEKPQKQ